MLTPHAKWNYMKGWEKGGEAVWEECELYEGRINVQCRNF